MLAEVSQRSRVKICGLTQPQDALAAACAGADAIGLVFYAKSPRFVAVDKARDIVKAVGPFVTTVGLFVNSDAHTVQDVLNNVPLHLLQFHGDEDNGFCRQFGRPFIKAVRMSPDVDVAAELQKFPDAQGFLFDAWQPDKYGGTGMSFDWQRLPPDVARQSILAGGLTPANVGEAINRVKPYAVDTSGGVESSPGKKSAQLIQQFIRACKSVSLCP